MFAGVMRRNKPIIPTRLPEPIELASSSDDTVKSITASEPAEIPVAEVAVEKSYTPPLSPASDTAGDGSVDDISTEDPTVEEASEIEATVAEVVTAKHDEVEVSSDDTPESEVETESDEDDGDDCMNQLSCRIYWVWFVFWVLAIIVGLCSFYMNIHQEFHYRRMNNQAPNEVNLLLMPREKWDKSKDVVAKPTLYTAQKVVVMHTETESCHTPKQCAKLISAIKQTEGALNYNFLLATDGCIYEGLGWREPSPLYSEVSTMVIAFIGNYETKAPSTMQLTQLQSLLEASEELKYLSSSYRILGKKVNVVPSKLFAYLSVFERWDNDNSDYYEDDEAEVEFEPFPMFDY